MYFLSKMGIFHCYVSLPEGNIEKKGSPSTLQEPEIDRISSSPHRIFQWFRLVLPESGESLQSFQLCTLVLPFYRAVRKKLPQVLGCPRFSNNIPGWWFRNPIPNHRLDVLYKTHGRNYQLYKPQLVNSRREYQPSTVSQAMIIQP